MTAVRAMGGLNTGETTLAEVKTAFEDGLSQTRVACVQHTSGLVGDNTVPPRYTEAQNRSAMRMKRTTEHVSTESLHSYRPTNETVPQPRVGQSAFAPSSASCISIRAGPSPDTDRLRCPCRVCRCPARVRNCRLLPFVPHSYKAEELALT
jgi:hypothetical protein